MSRKYVFNDCSQHFRLFSAKVVIVCFRLFGLYRERRKQWKAKDTKPTPREKEIERRKVSALTSKCFAAAWVGEHVPVFPQTVFLVFVSGSAIG